MSFEAAARPTEGIRRSQRISLLLLAASGAINYVDRATLAVGYPLIREDLHLSVVQMGALLSAFLWAYALAQLPAGLLVDRLGPRIALGGGLSLWSVAQAAAGLTGSFAPFAAMRVLLGIGEAPQSPTAARIVRRWFSPKQRGMATGIWNCSVCLGTAISAPLLTWLMLSLGWRGMFFVMGFLGVGIAVIWFVFYREPEDAGLSPAELNYLREDEGAADSSQTWEGWRKLLGSSKTWALCGGFFGIIYVIWLFNAWLPAYLETQHHLSIGKSGWVASIPFACGVLGSFAGGWWFDRRSAQPGASTWGLALNTALTLTAVAVFTALAAFCTTPVLAIGCICGAIFFGYASAVGAWSLATSAVEARYTGSLGSMQNFGGYIGGACAALATGYMVQATGSFKAALLVAAAISAVSALIYFRLAKTQAT